MTAVAKAIAATQGCAACVAKSRDTDFTTALLARPVDTRTPMRGDFPICCARAASGQATAPPSMAKNFRRAMNM
jgi:hypothetical protein